MSDHRKSQKMADSFLLNYDDAEIRIAAEFLSNWMPFLSRDLCKSCTRTLSDDIRSLHTGNFAASTPNVMHLNECKEDQGNCSAHSTGNTKDSADNNDCADTHSLGSWKDESDGMSEHAVEASPTSETFSSSAPIASPLLKKSWADVATHSSSGSWKYEADGMSEHAIETSPTSETFCASAPIARPLLKKSWADVATHSSGSWKDEADGMSEHAIEASPTSETFSASAPIASPLLKKSWADMSLEDELAEEEENDMSSGLIDANDSFAEGTSMNEAKAMVALSRDQREYIRFNSVQRKKDFICLERVNGKLVNILDGLELHKGVFSAAEQKRIVGYVEQLQEMGRNGQLKVRTYSAPLKWMRGKGRVTLQFGCCYNYATDKNGNPPGILRNEMVDPLPHLFKVMIKRLVRWCVLPPSCVPDSCIVNIYEEGDCIPPHIDNHDFVRPFCTVSFLSECEILFGSNLKIVGAGEFAGAYVIPLPVGSVLVINGNGADVAKHCVPAVPSKRISITFRTMDESKRPSGYVPEPDLQGLEPLSDDVERWKKYNSGASRGRRFMRKPAVGREDNRIDRGRGLTAKNPDSRYSGRVLQGPLK